MTPLIEVPKTMDDDKFGKFRMILGMVLFDTPKRAEVCSSLYPVTQTSDIVRVVGYDITGLEIATLFRAKQK